jgi:hypothetical protein
MYQELYEITNDPDMFFVQKEDEEETIDDLAKTKKISGAELGDIKEQAEKDKEKPEIQEIEVPVKREKKKEKSGKKIGFFKDLFKAWLYVLFCGDIIEAFQSIVCYFELIRIISMTDHPIKMLRDFISAMVQ